MDTNQVADRLVELCRQGRNLDAITELYAPNVVSVEAQAMPDWPAEQKGIDAIRAKNQWWIANHDIHRGSATGPFPHGDRFIVFFDYDVTAKDGPMKGQRMQLQEAALYTVTNGQITREEFFYRM